MSFNNDTESYICLSKSFPFSNNVFLKDVVSQNTLINYGLQSFQAVTRTLKLWLAITSDSNPFFKMGKTRHQKDGCSFYRVKFTWAWITLYPCFLDLMYASVHHFLYKKRNLFYHQYFPFYVFSGKYLCKTWWYHEIFG